MRIVYMGTPDFSVAALEALIKAGHEVTAVVTQPDKAKGRSKELQMSPVKECALKYGIPVFQPVKIRTPEAVEQLRTYEADVFVVAAFGQILSEEILTMPKYGCINIHASLLPKYRGAAPIQRAIIDGEKETGITIMQMDKGIDTGDILLQKKVTITQEETGESLFDKLAAVGAELIVEALPRIEKGEVKPVRQKEEESSYAGMLDKAMGHVDWSRSAREVDCLIRGMISWPGAYTYYHGKTLKIWKEQPDDLTENTEKYEPGMIVKVAKDSFWVKTAEGCIRVWEVQLEGKKRMAVKDFLLGCHMTEGELLAKV